jgi:hypothetical protein
MNKQKLQELLDRELKHPEDTVLGDFASLLIRLCRSQNAIPQGVALAASFDLLVGLFYYQKVPNRGWLLCTCGPEQYFFPFVNVCPRCALEQSPVYHKAGKSQSANIGAAAIKALILFIQEWFRSQDKDLLVFKGEEPVDLCILDQTRNILLLAEVKSAPLLTLPLVIIPDNASDEADTHESLTLGLMQNSKLGILLPFRETTKWKTKTLLFNKRFDNSDTYFVKMLTLLVKQPTFYKMYLTTWQAAFEAYSNRDKTTAIFWLTNGCGVPNPAPINWPDRTGSGRESISDGKTSVGLDRTDDIKKGVYQLLKLRLAPINQDFEVKVCIISNAHAARHEEEYIEPIANMMWLVSDLTDIDVVADLPPQTPIHNLWYSDNFCG